MSCSCHVFRVPRQLRLNSFSLLLFTRFYLPLLFVVGRLVVVVFFVIISFPFAAAVSFLRLRFITFFPKQFRLLALPFQMIQYLPSDVFFPSFDTYRCKIASIFLCCFFCVLLFSINRSIEKCCPHNFEHSSMEFLDFKPS